ncbi:MAG: transglutaminase domain-containing protein [Termitinemataceae bacterium]|nr:MAG: transglutaminase domain-containing protein [Termitinemataceae bacterium]
MIWNEKPAVICRSIALFALLFQLRLIAGDLADTPVFITTLLASFLVAFALIKVCPNNLQSQTQALRHITVVIIILLIPHAVRLLISLPRYFFDDAFRSGIIAIDTLLLDFDRNNFITILPFYWAAISTYFFCCHRRAARFSVFIDLIFLVVLFSLTNSASMNSSIEIYKLPIVKITVFVSILLMELFAALLSSPAELQPVRKEKTAAILFLLVMACVIGALLIRPMQERALEQNGGLIQPKMFSFDFAPYLRLESEIKTSDDLIFIMRKDTSTLDKSIVTNRDNFLEDLSIYEYHYLMRRYVLSAYNSGNEKDKSIGFFRNEIIDEANQSSLLPRGKQTYNVKGPRQRSDLRQEYYIVNLDGSAFIAMNEPKEVIPYQRWDASSFKSAYSVISSANYAFPVELLQTVPFDFDTKKKTPAQLAESLQLTEEEYAIYTDFGNKQKKTDREQRITELAEEITKNENNYWEKIQSLLRYLKYGSYRYSVKPGIAPNGDQLSHFIFDSKKGYCSYFAFAFASMLRSTGIPCRVAVGFFIDPREEKLGFFPVRASMAHAWVEVWFPEFGWIEYDPTTRQLADGEDEDPFGSFQPDAFEKLLKEILDNHDKLKEKEQIENDLAQNRGSAKNAVKMIKNFSFIFSICLIVFLLAYTRFRFYFKSMLTKNIRKKTDLLWKNINNILYFCSFKKSKGISEEQWAYELDKKLYSVHGDGVHSGGNRTKLFLEIYEFVARAKFAEFYEDTEYLKFKNLYNGFIKWYKASVPFYKRMIINTIPPVALLFKKTVLKTTLSALLFCFVIILNTSKPVFAQSSNINALVGATEIFQEAGKAEENEFWERAIELYIQGKKNYPTDERFPSALGQLYFKRELYSLAQDEFLLCEKLDSMNTYYLSMLAQTSGNLNNYKLSASYNEKLLALAPYDIDAISYLSWMYYKLHRLNESEALLLKAINDFGEAPGFCMTLATVYSDMFEYDKSKEYYLKALDSTKNRDYYLASLAAYNMSILESRFYNYDWAFRAASESLQYENRSSGHLARGEINLRRLAFKDTQHDYEQSYEKDKSPLTKLNMAAAFLRAGRLQESLIYAQDCLNQKNQSWMVNYGIDPDTYKRDLYNIIYKSYEGLLKTERFVIAASIKEKFKSFCKKITYQLKIKINKLLFQKYCSLAASSIINSDTEEKQILEALRHYFYAFEDYRFRALYYLNQAKNIELSLTPKALPSYLFEQGKLLKSQTILNDALNNFEQVWEQDMISDTYTELAILAKKQNKKVLLSEYTEQLFAMNSGALRQVDLRLPINLTVNSTSKNIINNFTKQLNKVGFIIRRKEDAARFNLTLTITNNKDSDYEIFVTLYDTIKDSVSLNNTYELKSVTKKDVSDFVNSLANEIFVAK